jgi:hypothetical protein
MYEGATPDEALAGMFSFVPCLPAAEGGFERPAIRLPGYVNPRNWRQATCSDPMELDAVVEVWGDVVRQVLDARLALATRLKLVDPS